MLEDRTLALESLCAEIFADADELRHWVRNHLPPEIGHKLPGGYAPAAILCHELAQLVERRGLTVEITKELLRSRRRTPSGYLARARWQRRYALSRALALALTLVWFTTRAYPSLDISRTLLRFEQAALGFLPIPYRHIGLPAVILLTSAVTLAFWTAARISRTTPND